MSSEHNSLESKDNTKAAAETFNDFSFLKDLKAEVPLEHHSHKLFEHAVINWTVDNFSYNYNRIFSLRSSTFDLYATVPTSWCLGLTWPKNDALEIHLIRMGTNPVKKIKVSGRVGYVSEDCLQIRWQRDFCVINTKTGLCFSRESDILRHTFGCFKIVFQFFIYKVFKREPFEYSLNTVQAMNILKPKIHGENCIPVTILSKEGFAYTIDKSICSQSPVLTQKITESENNIVSLPFDAAVIFQCLSYLYFKRLVYTVNVRTSVNLYLAAKFLKMQDLEKYISPTEIDFYSKAGGKVFKIESEVPQKKLDKDGYYSYPSSEDLLWWLELKSTEEDIQAIVDIHRCDRELDINCKIFGFSSKEIESFSIEKYVFANTRRVNLIRETLINKERNTEHRTTALCSHLRENCPMFIPSHRNIISIENIIFVQWNLCHSDMRFKNRITKITRSSTPTGSGLAISMAGLSISDDSDIVIIAGDKKFRVHKEILKSRSESFMDLLSGKNECEVTVPDMPVDLMELIVKFIYRGKLYTNNWEIVRRLYLKLSEFRVYFLPLICEEFFLYNLNTDNWKKLLKRAIKSKNLTFVKNIVECICNRKTISQSEKWKAKISKRKFRKKVSKLFKNSGLSISFDS